MSKRSKEEREAARQAARQAARLLRKERRRSIRQLDKAGARHIADHEQLSRSQTSMLARFARADIPDRVWRRLERCKPGRCAKDICSAACWFGDRGHINALMLEAADLLRGCDMPLRFVTIIDPNHFTAVGDLKIVSTRALMQSLRRRFREAGDLFNGARAFGAIEVAIEGDETGREWWSSSRRTEAPPQRSVLVIVRIGLCDLAHGLISRSKQRDLERSQNDCIPHTTLYARSEKPEGRPIMICVLSPLHISFC